jgi:hypothetical protein
MKDIAQTKLNEPLLPKQKRQLCPGYARHRLEEKKSVGQDSHVIHGFLQPLYILVQVRRHSTISYKVV